MASPVTLMRGMARVGYPARSVPGHVHPRLESARAWYGLGEKAVYRFLDNNAGEMHFSGIMEDDYLILSKKPLCWINKRKK